ncbi:CopY/TcrY family copper transport repressor [Paucilactobacillus suebicus]|uniref:Negative regulator of copper transport operon, AtkY n=1 Tax=Paucilactobacillus suebicus DSM 5007 = KCTC 3549 TaxID=1423807 RepID=A0A0R1W4B1_9LACO|nr:CopY/TcrY family copper transport repressor [Paucilactobacillus suebicus]KRM12386.1 negative regulator of copper transport operon, AtkY [Paucilactobacillus suebicus DSM 5007 = KCTC 3549]
MDSTSTQTKIDDITPAEWELMRIVWTKGSVYSRELISLMQQKRDWSDSTIKTLLRRLVQKGLLNTEKEDRKFKYTAAVEEIKAMDVTARQLFDHLCAMKRGQTLVNLIDHLELSQSDIESLQAVLTEKKKTAPETVKCDCLPEGMDETCDCN